MKEKNAKVNPVLVEEMHRILEKIEKVATKLRDNPTFVREVNESKPGIPLTVQLVYYPFYNKKELEILIFGGLSTSELEIVETISELKVPLSVGNLNMLRKQFVKSVKIHLGTNYEASEFFHESSLREDENENSLEYLGVYISSFLEVRKIED